MPKWRGDGLSQSKWGGVPFDFSQEELPVVICIFPVGKVGN